MALALFTSTIIKLVTQSLLETIHRRNCVNLFIFAYINLNNSLIIILTTN